MGSVNANFSLQRRNILKRIFPHAPSRDLRRHDSPPLRRPSVKIIFTAIYLLALTTYLIIGLQPPRAEASGDIRLQIPEINLSAAVDNVEKQGSTIPVPDRIAGAYYSDTNKILLVGHSSTVFHDLDQLTTGDTLTYDDQEYLITEMETKPKSAISMPTLLAPASKPTLILMTCAGDPLDGHDYTHRLIITASSI